MVKIWDIDDLDLADDLAELQRKFGQIPGANASVGVEVAWTKESEMTYESTSVADPINILVTGVRVEAVAVENEEHHDQLADIRAEKARGTSKCKTCCCEAHHCYSLHYSGGKFVSLPSDSLDGVNSTLAMEFDMATSGKVQEESKDSLEDMIMSVNLDIS